MLDRQACVARDPSHRQRIYRIVSRYCEDPNTVGHDNVFSLTDDLETCLLERPNGIQVINAWDLWHGSPYHLDLSHNSISQKLVARLKILLDSILNVGKGFLLRSTL